MTQIRKVPFNAGAEWLLASFALLRKAPLALCLLGVIWGGLSALVSFSGLVWLNLVVLVLGPILFGGVIYAVREVDLGRSAQPAHLLQGLQGGKTLRLLAMLLPQLAALLLLALLLLVMIGGEQLQQITQVMQQMESNPDPELLAKTLPAGRIFGWLVLALMISVVAGFFTFIATPDVMFTERGAFAAMAVSFRACLRNVGALVVMTLLLFIAMFAVSLVFNILIMLLAFVIGQQIALILGQLLLMAVLIPVMGGTVYYAWRSILGDVPPAVPVAPALGGIEV